MSRKPPRSIDNVREDTRRLCCRAVTVSVAGRILETNALFRDDFGERLGEHCFAVYKQQDRPCENCPVLRVFEDGGTHSSEETVVTADGRDRKSVV